MPFFIFLSESGSDSELEQDDIDLVRENQGFDVRTQRVR